MTDTECNKFLTLLMGECWHDLENKQYVSGSSGYNYTKCKLCGKEFHFGMSNPDHLSNPLPVIKWMEKEMPEVLESYLDWAWVGLYKERQKTGYQISFSKYLVFVFDLCNLVTYLIEHPEWGEKECKLCKGKGGTRVLGVTVVCPECSGTGKIIHPALAYLREVKG